MSSKIQTEELRLPVPWGFVAAKAWGFPQNSPVLVVHGLMDNAGSFNRLIPLLPKRFYYVSIDLPGHGFSSHFQAGVPLDFFNYVLSIELAIKALDISIMESEIQTDELRFKVPWGHVAAKAWGFSKDSPVLLVHGVMDNAGSFTRLISLLPKQFYYVCIDLPGHGYSSHFPFGVPLDFFNYVLCIRLVLQELNWKSCVCIAHSLGALIVYFYTYFYPGIIKKFVSIDTAVPRSYDGDLLKSRVIEEHNSAFDHLNKEDKVFSKEEIIYALQARRKHYMKKEAAEAVFERAVTNVDGGYKYNRDPRLKILPRPHFNYDQCVEYLQKETVPTLFIVSSTLSPFLSEEGAREKYFEFVKRKKTIEFVVVEGNHDLHTNHPERIVPFIERFLEKIISKL